MKFYKVILIVVFCFTAKSISQSDTSLKGVGANVGYILPDGIENAMSVGIFADLGTFENFAIRTTLDYWSKKYTKDIYWDWQWSVISAAVMGTYSFDFQNAMQPYLGGGLGFDVSSWQNEYTGPLDPQHEKIASETDFDLAVHLVAGVSYEFSPNIATFAQIKFTSGGIDYFGIYLGLLYTLK